ncbi:hypothetical protein [Deinococcus multiflagellatus]|uniref:Uncharacterized protein n=1 Tax=Deinococcus multiflagellatus TaxID=1656887 RepID=A0ABW1ZNW3_9DEIO|nr:hypothetical protein [Deinococcus multiflagellatus]MBZ9715149.1 hypothetical protein [Deinococcus multiflagellatus]
MSAPALQAQAALAPSPAVLGAEVLRLRPGVGHVPIRSGIRFQHWATTFRIQGHPALHALFLRLLPGLTGGVTAAELQASLPERAWPAAKLLLDELRARDLLLPADTALTPAEVGEHAGVLRFLDSLSASPAAAFRAVRAARVTLRGPQALTRSVAAHLRDLAFVTVDAQPAPGPFIALYLNPSGAQAPLLLAALDADQGVIAPLHTPEATLRRRLTLDGDAGVPLTELLSGLLALEAFRAAAGLPGGVTEDQALVVDAATLRSARVPAFLQRATEGDWWAVAHAPAPLAGPDDLAALLSGPFALTDAPGAAGEQLPLFTYGTSGGAGRAGWGTDGTEALNRAAERRLLALLPGAPLDLNPGEYAFPVLGYHETDLLGRGLNALLSAELARAPQTFTAQPLPPADLPLAHLWLFKSLGMVYGVGAQVVSLGHPALRGLHGAAVYDPARGLLASSFQADPDTAIRHALVDAVAALQLALPLPGAPLPPAGEVHPAPATEPERETWAALDALDRALRLIPDLSLPGTVQRGVLLGWVSARA